MSDARRRIRPRKLSVLLTTEGTYPYNPGGVSTWCESIVRGTPEIDYVLLPLIMTPQVAFQYAIPSNIRRVVHVPMWGIEEPAEFIEDVPFASLYLRKRRTSGRAIETKFAPLFERFLQLINEARTDCESLGRVLSGLAEYFSAHDYNATMKSALAWEMFVREMNAYSVRVAASVMVHAQEELPTLFDMTESLRWLYRFLMILNAPLPRTALTHSTAAAFCGIPCIIAKVRHGTPMLLTEHGVYMREQNLNLSRFRRLIFSKRFLLNLINSVSRANYWFADRISPVCHYNTRWEREQGTPEGKIRVVYNGVDTQRYAPGPRAPGPPHVIAAARIDPLKDVESFLRMAALMRATHPDVRYTIFGAVSDESYYRRCLEFRRGLGLEKIVVMGSPAEDVAAAYRDSDVVVLTSISEAFPYSVIEAMACGKPVIASDVGGVREALEGCGIVVKPRDPDAFAYGLRLLLDDAQLRTSMGIAARKKVLAEFTLEKNIQGYRQLYEDLASGEAA